MDGYADVRCVAGSWPKAFRGSIGQQKAVGWFARVAAFASIWPNWQNNAGYYRSQISDSCPIETERPEINGIVSVAIVPEPGWTHSF
jgi:hypothetical protein